MLICLSAGLIHLCWQLGMKCPNIMREINQPNGASFSIDYGLSDLASFFATGIVPAPT